MRQKRNPLSNQENNMDKIKNQSRIIQLAHSVRRRAPLDAVVLLERENNTTIAAVLEELDDELAMRLLSHLPTDRTEELVSNIDATIGSQWSLNLNYDEDSVGRLMEPLPPTFSSSSIVKDVIDTLRNVAKKQNIIYAFAVNSEMKLEGVVVMRDLLLAEPSETLADIMVSEPFYF